MAISGAKPKKRLALSGRTIRAAEAKPRKKPRKGGFAASGAGSREALVRRGGGGTGRTLAAGMRAPTYLKPKVDAMGRIIVQPGPYR